MGTKLDLSSKLKEIDDLAIDMISNLSNIKNIELVENELALRINQIINEECIEEISIVLKGNESEYRYANFMIIFKDGYKLTNIEKLYGYTLYEFKGKNSIVKDDKILTKVLVTITSKKKLI